MELLRFGGQSLRSGLKSQIPISSSSRRVHDALRYSNSIGKPGQATSNAARST